LITKIEEKDRKMAEFTVNQIAVIVNLLEIYDESSKMKGIDAAIHVLNLERHKVSNSVNEKIRLCKEPLFARACLDSFSKNNPQQDREAIKVYFNRAKIE
jgi:urocanate hydratase